MKLLSSIRGKLLFCFFVFILLFNIVSVSIYFSSSRLTNEYNTSFERFLIFNSISQQANDLYEDTNAYVRDPSEENLTSYYRSRLQLRDEENRLEANMKESENIELSNYLNLIESLIRNSEVTVGFVLRDDIERYTSYLQETQNSASYIQENTLSLIDLELTEYQKLYADLQNRNEAFRVFIIFLFITTVMIAVFFAFWFSAGINRPLQSLSAAAKEVSRGDFKGEPVSIQSNDEMKLLGDTFDQMRTDITEYVEEMKGKAEMDRLMKELELKHLQNQINPHFLFNTLNTVSKMAYLEDADDTSHLIDSVSALLRYNLGDLEKSVTLKDEIEVVQSYFHIQQTRFQGRIHFSVELEETELNRRVPRLILQPLVENAFIHGVECLEEGGTISLRVYQQEKYTIAEVEDNGIGMEREQLQSVLSPNIIASDGHVGHSTGLGLTNVIRRLQLFYQLEDVVEIESEPDGGTVIRLFLPECSHSERGI
ncbi:nitrogen fixation/metabolism regulation signal transduction histidine kinase [Salibacterium salarium]|uniref:sensor histidine kinase n=1 Tax=Salibacterium salarium TaxID=284579 RepID=UPI0027810DFF|nr:sensor histidine kinase [Salibacterium salarium]MDQ0298154.1 nitrogen fixation/metabolism regulation signal transduction histidine kinase [Salibacterium salarium]